MGLSRRRAIASVVALAVLVLAACAAIPLRFLVGVVVFTRKWLRQASRERDHLFFETDYQELLMACRTLSGQTAAGELRSGQYHVHLGKRDPETLSFPQVILDLQPACVLMDFHNPGEVVIELFPGPEWFGVKAFPEDSEGQGDVKLIEGLWYFDSCYNDSRPKYVARINDMIKKGRRLRASRVAVQPEATQ